jgi:hypothetical protein
MIKYSKDGKVSFNSETHTYLLGDKYLQGVTGLISKYKNKFDAEKVAAAYALKHGLDKDELLKQWELKGKQACEHGTAVHKVFETFGLTGKIETTGLYSKETIAVKFINEVFKTNRLIPVEVEIIVYNNCIASQIDMVAKNSIGEYFKFDWKTNDKIEKNGYGKFMLFPFNIYPDACFYHYSTQLTIYDHLCNEYKTKGSYIVHIDEQDYNIIKAENIHIPRNILNNE